MTLRLAVTLRDTLVRTHVFDAVRHPRITIGRLPSCDVPLENLALSRQHALIVREGREWVLRDLGSRNGVFVNGAPKPVHALASGDVLGFAKFTVAVTVDDAPPRAAEVEWVHPTAAAGAHLVVKGGDVPGGVYSLERDVFTVGGHRSCELQLRGPLAPRRLALIVRGRAGYALVNVSSRAEGVWRNGQPVTDRCSLEDGDRLELESVLARFAVGSARGVGAP
jgi:pSer/pThr/pTyr-binding forkhead associated (FHA) protein